MELIAKEIGLDLKTIIKSEFEKVSDLIYKQNQRINHINIYHKDWGCNSCTDLINILHKDYSIDPTSIISLGFINSKVNSYDQHFHIDYVGTTETYFIPMIDLNDLNGTEYVEFNDKEFNKKILNELIEITDEFIDRNQIINHFAQNKITDYSFKILNGNAWSMVKMPYYVFHRGQKNKGQVDRTMFQIITGRTSDVKVSSGILIEDSELDENNDIVDKLLSNRKTNKNI